jgi:hypothetical protein
MNAGNTGQREYQGILKTEDDRSKTTGKRNIFKIFL